MPMTTVREQPDMNEAQRTSRPPASDPYLELELYLEKVNEEIGKVFDQYLEKDVDQPIEAKSIRDHKISTESFGCYKIHIGTQTSPTRSQNSSPVWVSDCSSSFTCQSSGSSSSSVQGDDTKSVSVSSSSLDNSGRSEPTSEPSSEQVPGVSSDSELLFPSHQNASRSKLENVSQFRTLSKKCSDDSSIAMNRENLERLQRYGSSTSRLNGPVWILRQDVKKQLSAKDRRGVVFDGLDEPDDACIINTSAHSLPLPDNNMDCTHHGQTLLYNHNHHSNNNMSNMLIVDLGNKSSSAPVLKKADESSEQLSSHVLKVTKQPRSQSDRHLAEIQAAEACKWLRAAGFPQYAQMYEDHQFPIDLSSVQKDHLFLELDSCRSLFRRLDTLNRCANIKVDSWRSTHLEDSEDENQCALSENWTFQHDQKRWSRICANEPLQPLQNINATTENADSVWTTENKLQHGNLQCGDCVLNTGNTGSGGSIDSTADDVALARTGSERIKDGAKALLRRVESLKSRRRKRQNREGVVISGPQVVDVHSLQQRLDDMNCFEIQSLPTALLSVDCTQNSAVVSPHYSPINRSPLPSPRRLFIPSPLLSHGRDSMARRALVNRRGSVSLDRRDNIEIMSDTELQKLNRKLRNISDQTSIASDYDSDVEDTDLNQGQTRASWHSFQRGSLHTAYSKLELYPISSLTCGQLQVLRKLALLKLTALIEKHCPTHKTGWNWELPKFIRKIKTPDYKDKTVFGVPLTVILQRSGYPLPKGIQKALQWLLSKALDQVGLFRKPGVKSRIHSLKCNVESTNDFTSCDDQQAYDVADMVKQYFRELPEALLTTKLSETLILIFQYVPVFLRREAVSCVLLLMPNEHCEVLQNILNFLLTVSEHSSVNQMTASNLALCFAPSLFYYSHSVTVYNNMRTNSVSPRRRKATGAPDPKELAENKAAHECLLYLINNQYNLFTVPKDMMAQCKFTDLDESKPIQLSELGEPAGNWKNYMDACVNALQKEVKERSRGWVYLSGGHISQVELAYKKVGDGHPLRLWRVATEVEAPPQEVLHRVLRERHIWDPSLLKVRVIQQLDQQSEVYQYLCSSMSPLTARDYCVLRTWKKDLARGACVIVETSVEHKDADVLQDSVRAVVLASRYLIEPCGSGKSRLLHLSRIDMMGRTPEWYNKNYGHICKLHLYEIRNSFKHSAAGPESKV